ncbi:hypothetical protein T4D_15750 [Trichinella pseudospiralis]|uniref:Uncharacterized protein n=1 Tax=Trichinella pseudospiralis TaxID=6337 RepID=A0A0V1DLT5_TRIPS|nr:hypothetical protein T4D_15750 [Trichinella pseudospiralis]
MPIIHLFFSQSSTKADFQAKYSKQYGDNTLI